MRSLVALLVMSASSASAESEACRQHLRDAYIALSEIPVHMSEALSDARADGETPARETLSEPDRFAEENAVWGERIIELVDEWCR